MSRRPTKMDPKRFLRWREALGFTPERIQKVRAMRSYELARLELATLKSDAKKAYRKLAREHHPDQGGQPSDFRELQEVHERLQGLALERRRPVQAMVVVTWNGIRITPGAGYSNVDSYCEGSWTWVP